MNDASRSADGQDAGDPRHPGGNPHQGSADARDSGETTALGAGTSPFDEPTGEFPPAEPPSGSPAWSSGTGGAALGGSAQSGSGQSGYGRPDDGLGGYGAQEQDPDTRVLPRRHVVSREDDVLGTGGEDQQTTRIPTYEELSSPAPAAAGTSYADRREPEDIAAAMDQALTDSPAKAKRGTLDLGLLVIRVVLGAILFAHGLQKLTGRWGGPDLDGFRSMLETTGFDYAHALSIAGPVGEVVVGALLILGLLTPVAAAGAVALLINAWCFMQAGTSGVQFFTNQSGEAGSGVEFETMLLAAAVALVLTGPGLISLDVKRGWTRRPLASAWVFLVVGIAAGVAVWVVFNGANPFGDEIAGLMRSGG